jgi:hypothetical protein
MDEDKDSDINFGEKSLAWIARNWVWLASIYAFSVTIGLLFLKSPNNWNELGDFLAGFFAPLAFLMLVVALFVQSRELKEQVKEIRLSVEAQRDSADTLAMEVFNNFMSSQMEELAYLAFRFQKKVFINQNHTSQFNNRNHHELIGMILEHLYKCLENPDQKHNYFEVVERGNDESYEFQRRVLDYQILCGRIIERAKQVDQKAASDAESQFMLSPAGQLYTALKTHLIPKFKTKES